MTEEEYRELLSNKALVIDQPNSGNRYNYYIPEVENELQ